jgi:carboxyl-terminal processing protease
VAFRVTYTINHALTLVPLEQFDVTARPHLFTRLLSVLLLAAATLPPTPLHAAELEAIVAPPVVQAAVGARPSAAEALNLSVVRQAYDLLLDRYYQNPDPAAVLNASYAGLVAVLKSSGVQVKSPGPLSLESDREKAWSVYSQQVGKLLQESPAPDKLVLAPPPPTGDSPVVPQNPNQEPITLTDVAIDALTRSVDELHTGYLTRGAYRELLAQSRGEQRYGGIGIRATRPGFTIAEVFPGSPAESAGLQPGDQVVAVDGRQVGDLSLAQVTTLVRGPEGSTVVIDVLRPKTAARLTLPIVRASIRVANFTARMIMENIGYMQLRTFLDPSVYPSFRAFAEQVTSDNSRGLIIDLRGNGGGLVDLGTRMLNLFIPSGPLYQITERGGTRQVQLATGPGLKKQFPIEVLVDEGTASMGELFASAMREHGVATLVGKKTAGAVAGAQIYPLQDGSAIEVTVLDFLSGNGQPLNRVGVTPDIAFDITPSDLEAGRDPQLEAAIVDIWGKTPNYALAP